MGKLFSAYIPLQMVHINFFSSTPAQRTSVIKAFRGRVCQLLRHTEASDVVETAYSDHATAAERLALLLEFYGADLAHLKVTRNRRIHFFILLSSSKGIVTFCNSADKYVHVYHSNPLTKLILNLIKYDRKA